MAIILPERKLKVFNTEVEFTSAEMLKWKTEGLPIDSEMLEMMLISNEVDHFDEQSSPDFIHKTCVKAIEDWIYVIYKTIEIMKKDKELFEELK